MTENKSEKGAKPSKKKSDVDALLNEVTAANAPKAKAPKAEAAPEGKTEAKAEAKAEKPEAKADEKKPVKAVFKVGGPSNKVAPGAIPAPAPKAAAAPAAAPKAKVAPAAKAEPKKPEPEVVKAMITIRQIRSGICAPVDQKQALVGLGLRHIRQEVVRPDSRAIRGQILKVRHLVEVVASTPVTK